MSSQSVSEGVPASDGVSKTWLLGIVVLILIAIGGYWAKATAEEAHAIRHDFNEHKATVGEVLGVLKNDIGYIKDYVKGQQAKDAAARKPGR
jgi:hypothetical protein